MDFSPTPGETYTWYMQAWNYAGTSDQNSGVDFTFDPTAKPAAPTAISPAETISTVPSNFVCNPTSAALEYHVVVTGPSGVVQDKWYSPKNPYATCSVPFTFLPIPGVPYSWYVEARNPAGTSDPSSPIEFTFIPTERPRFPTGELPRGILTKSPQKFRWGTIAEALEYRLLVIGPSGAVHDAWYSGADAYCGQSTCSVSLNLPIVPDEYYTWYLQARNAVGTSDQNSGIDFLYSPRTVLYGLLFDTDQRNSTAGSMQREPTAEPMEINNLATSTKTNSAAAAGQNGENSTSVPAQAIPLDDGSVYLQGNTDTSSESTIPDKNIPQSDGMLVSQSVESNSNFTPFTLSEPESSKIFSRSLIYPGVSTNTLICKLPRAETGPRYSSADFGPFSTQSPVLGSKQKQPNSVGQIETKGPVSTSEPKISGDELPVSSVTSADNKFSNWMHWFEKIVSFLGIGR
jgi:hypothetical protein